MKKTITSKIKIISLIFVILIISTIGTTIYLNKKNKKVTIILEYANKQRAITQAIIKNIFYIYHNNNQTTKTLNDEEKKFIHTLTSLKKENTLIHTNRVLKQQVLTEISQIEKLWKTLDSKIEKFKKLSQNENKKVLKNLVNEIFQTNDKIISQLDKLINLYTKYSKKKTNYITYFQYIFLIIIILLMFYSYFQLKSIEQNAKKFLKLSKKIKEKHLNEPIEPMKLEAEEEILEATDIFNYFINKINSVIKHSNDASSKLKNLTNEFDKTLNKLKDSQELSKQLFKSEDMVIQSQENLLIFINKLEELKKELNSLSTNSKNKDNAII